MTPETIEKRKAYNKIYSKTHYKINRDRYLKKGTAWDLANPEKMLLCKARANAKSRGWEFDLTIEDIIIPEKCPLLGCILTNTRGLGRQQSNISIDRIDSSKGYKKGNIQVISNLANRMKAESTKEQLVIFAKNILENYL